MSGLDSVGVTYCHQYTWAHQQITSNVKGTPSHDISCATDEYIKGVNVKMSDESATYLPTELALIDAGATPEADFYWGSSARTPFLDDNGSCYHNDCNSYAKWSAIMKDGLVYKVESLII